MADSGISAAPSSSSTWSWSQSRDSYRSRTQEADRCRHSPIWHTEETKQTIHQQEKQQVTKIMNSKFPWWVFFLSRSTDEPDKTQKLLVTRPMLCDWTYERVCHIVGCYRLVISRSSPAMFRSGALEKGQQRPANTNWLVVKVLCWKATHRRIGARFGPARAHGQRLTVTHFCQSEALLTYGNVWAATTTVWRTAILLADRHQKSTSLTEFPRRHFGDHWTVWIFVKIKSQA